MMETLDHELRQHTNRTIGQCWCAACEPVGRTGGLFECGAAEVGPPRALSPVRFPCPRAANSGIPWRPARNQVVPSSSSSAHTLATVAFSVEIWLNIFQHLSRPQLQLCASVCRFWRDLCYQHYLWRFLDISPAKVPFVTVRRLLTILHRGIQELRYHSFAVKPSQFADLPILPLKLRHCDFSGSTIDDLSFQVIIERCPQLEVCNVTSCTQLTAESFLKLSQTSHHLKSLSCNSTSINDDALIAIIEANRQISKLECGWTNITAASTNSIVKLKSLQFLDLSGMGVKLLNGHVLKIFESCHELQKIDLSDCQLLTDVIVDAMIRNGCKLQWVALSRCREVCLEALDLLVRGLPQLKRLELFCCYNAVYEFLVAAHPHLKINELMIS